MFEEMKHSVKNLILQSGRCQLKKKWNNGLRENILYWCWMIYNKSVKEDKEVAEMFTVGSHHLNFSLIYLCHNIFGKGWFA